MTIWELTRPRGGRFENRVSDTIFHVAAHERRRTLSIDVLESARPDAEATPATDAFRTPRVLTDGSGDPDALNWMFRVLSHPYRRRILLLASERNPRDEEEFSVEDLATADDDFELLSTELYHVHLPMLAEAGYIEWDRDERTIRRGRNFDDIAPLLRLMHDHQDELPVGWP